MHEDAARKAFGSDDVVKLASNESPWGPHPAVLEAITRAARNLHRYPDQHARRLRRRIAEFCDRVPSHVTIALDEAYVEFQTDDDPDATVDLLADFPNLVVLRTFSKAYGLAGLRCGFALCSAKFRGAVDAVRQPFSVNGLAQAAAAEAILHQDDVAKRVERTIVERVYVEEGVRELGLEPAESQANFIWIPVGDRDEDEVIRGLGEAGIVVRGGEGLGGPGHIRVTYGTRRENERFLEAFAAAL